MSPFFPFLAAMLLAINLVGFAPTYFLRPSFGGAALPLRTHVHGTLFLSWFLLLLVQSLLAPRGRMRSHRALGLTGGILAFLMVPSGVVTLYHGVGEFVASGGTVPRASQFMWGNLLLLGAFASFTALGFRLRFRREAHMRLMALASLSLISQSIARIAEFRVFQDAGLGEEGVGPFTLAGLAALLLSLVVHDLVVRKRIHPATGWGAPALVLAFALGIVVLPSLSVGQALVRLLY